MGAGDEGDATHRNAAQTEIMRLIYFNLYSEYIFKLQLDGGK